MKLYYTPGACSLAVRILLNEMKQPSEYEAVDLKTKKTEAGHDYLQINPKGAVPALKADGHLMTENAVIHQYLADHYKKTDLLPPVSDPKRYQVLEWLNFVTTELHKGFAPLFNPKLPQDVQEQIFKPNLVKKFEYIDHQLGKNKFLVGDHYTLPDGYLFVMLLWAQSMKIDLSKFKHLTKYFDAMKHRESIQQAMKAEKLG